MEGPGQRKKLFGLKQPLGGRQRSFVDDLATPQLGERERALFPVKSHLQQLTCLPRPAHAVRVFTCSDGLLREFGT